MTSNDNDTNISQGDQIQKAIAICGPRDLSRDGENGNVEITGEFAAFVISRWFNNPDYRKMHSMDGAPIRLSRSGHLELWCQGVYTEGSGVRGIIHDAIVNLNASHAAR